MDEALSLTLLNASLVLRANSKTYTVSKLVTLHTKGRLNLQPWFQRNAIWPERARYGLIDTIFRGLPVPEVFIWKSGDNYSVIDGQQRLRAVIDFVNGKGQDNKNKKYAIKQLANTSIMIHQDLKNKTYQDLGKQFQPHIDSFIFDIREITTKDKTQVEDLFHRLNTNVFENNAQELRNAVVHGDLKTLANDLTKEFRNFLLDNKIRTLKQIGRQLDTQTVINEILLLAVKGEITGSDKKIQDDLYHDNKKMGNKAQIRSNIIKTKNMIERILPSADLKVTMFTKHTNYLALFSALYLAITGGWDGGNAEQLKYGYPDSNAKRKRLQRSLEDFSRDVTNRIENSNRRGGGKLVADYVDAFNERHTTEKRIRLRKAITLMKIMVPNLILLDIKKGPNNSDRKWLWSNWKKRSKDNKPLCAKCNRRIPTFAKMDVGHKLKKALGGPNARRNYQPEHFGCNRSDNQI